MSITDLLADAGRLHAQGYFLPAGLLLRIVLERWLHAQAFAVKPGLSGRNGILAYAEILKAERLIDADAFAAIRKAGSDLNKAAHGKSLTAERAAELLALVRTFVLPKDLSCPPAC